MPQRVRTNAARCLLPAGGYLLTTSTTTADNPLRGTGPGWRD
ncbi:hypothetical protein [Micromonospora parva]